MIFVMMQELWAGEVRIRAVKGVIGVEGRGVSGVKGYGIREKACISRRVASSFISLYWLRKK